MGTLSCARLLREVGRRSVKQDRQPVGGSFMQRSSRSALGTDEQSTRRDILRRFASASVITTAGAGITQLFGISAAKASTTQSPQLPATMILNALPANAPPTLAAAIEAGCCITYTRDEHACGSSSCPSGYCCYHVTSTDCNINETVCVEVSCAEGNFTTGC
jgi:hypothetical protein